jgi:hypothetical protein
MPFDPNKPVESLVQGLASSRADLWRAITTHPRQAVATAAAAVVAPFFMKDDERGYFKTSLITTPLVLAGSVAARPLLQTGQSVGSRIINYSRRSYNDIARSAGVPTWQDMTAFRQEFEKGNMFYSEYQKSSSLFLNDITQPQRDLVRERKALMANLRRAMGDDSKTYMLQNALYAESSRAMSASQLATRPHSNNLAPAITRGDMFRMRRFLKNQDFVSGLNYRLQQMDRLVDSGVSTPVEYLKGLRVDSKTWDESPYRAEALRRMNPRLYKEIESGISAGRIDPKMLEIISLEQLSPGEAPSIVDIPALRAHRPGHKPLEIHLVGDQGSIRMGGTKGGGYDRSGVSRKVFDNSANEVVEADVYAVRHLGDNFDELADVMNKSQFGGYLDKADDSFRTIEESESFAYQLDPFNAAARNRQVLIPGYNKLNPKQQEEALIKLSREQGMIKTWSEGSLNKGILELEELAAASPGGVYNVEKQARQLRGLKPFMASFDDVFVKIPTNHAPFSRTNFFEKVLPGVTLPEFGTRLGGVSPHIKSLIGDLPKRRKYLMDKSTGDMALQYIMKDLADRGQPATEKEARRIWTQMREYLHQDQNLANVRKLGYLGEGDHLILGNQMPKILSPKTYYVHDLRLKDIDSMITNKTAFGSDMLLGMLNGNPISAQSKNNVVTGYKKLADGRIGLQVVGSYDIAGGKTDAHTKGLNLGTSDKEATGIRDFLNQYYNAAGSGIVPDDVDMLSLHHYSHNKASVGEQSLNNAADLMRRLEKTGELNSIDGSREALEAMGFRYDGATLVEDIESFKGLNYEAKAARLQQAVDIINQMMEDVGARVRSNQIKGDQFLQAFRRSQGHLTDFIHQYASPVNAMLWDTIEQGVPKDASITYDMLGILHARGYEGTVKELAGRARVDGNTMLTRRVMEYLDRGDFQESLGPAMTAEEAVPDFSGKMASLNHAGERADTVFDPGHEKAAGNWSLKLKDGTHVPVLGHEAYGGKINQYGSGEFSTNDRERLLTKVMEADAAGDKELLDKAKGAYISELQRFGYGKEGFLRVDRTDPDGLAGFIQTRPSEIPGNPFEIGLSSETIAKIKDKQIRRAIMRGEEIYAATARHPVSAMPFVRVTKDNRLNGNIIGLDEGMRGMLMADDDKDIVSAFFFRPGSSAWKEAHNAVNNPTSDQHQELRVQRALEGLEDDSRIATETAFKKLSTRAVVEDASKTVESVLRARTAGGSIGRFSNVLTGLRLGLESNSNITSNAQRSILDRVFWSIRQAPIAAQKSKAANVTGIEDALRMAEKLEKGFSTKSDKGFDLFYNSLLDTTRSFGKSVAWNNDMLLLGLTPDLAIEGKINPLMKYVEQNRKLFENYHRGLNDDVVQVTRALTATEGQVLKYDGKLLAGLASQVHYLQNGTGRPQSSGARMAAEALGAANEGVKNIGREVSSLAHSPHVGGILGTGLGVAAVAGLLTTSLKSPRQEAMSAPGYGARSSNSYRPEHMIGTTDQASGDPVTGSGAPTSPPRRIVEAQPGTKTMVVAPMRQAVDLEVRTKASDRDKAAEQAKIMARMSTDGDSLVTVNYRTGLRRNSLRMQEKFRDMRER